MPESCYICKSTKIKKKCSICEDRGYCSKKCQIRDFFRGHTFRCMSKMATYDHFISLD